MNQREVDVKVCSFIDFFEKEAAYKVGIDSYQRPYVWSREKVQDLISDLSDYLENPNGLAYYMGTVLLHEKKADNETKLFIIDGQQRLTTLCILHYVLTGELHEKMSMKYNSPLSAENIRQSHELLENNKVKLQEKDKGLLSNIDLTFITTQSEDQAFTFFDTQNNRGVKLKPTDLLKAYHLRAIENSGKGLGIQTLCAKRWEKMQAKKFIFGLKEDFTARLFHQFLWRARCWRGQKMIYREEDEHVLNEFQKKAIPVTKFDSVSLYPNACNLLGEELQLTQRNEQILHPAKIYSGASSAYLPFTLRQPISEGLGFFLFADKYSEMVHLLFFDDKNNAPQITALRAFYKQVWTDISLYLKELFFLAVLMYYDKFQNKQLLEFALWLDHILGAIRLDKSRIYKEAPLKFLKDKTYNLLDVISQAFLPDEVIQFLKGIESILEVYKSYKIKKGQGVQDRYIKNVLTYYSKQDFTDKENWIKKDFINRKLEDK